MRSLAGARITAHAIAFPARRLLCVLLIAVLLPAMPAGALSQSGFAAQLQPLLLQARHPFLEHGDLAKERPAIESLYRQRDYSPLWINASGALTAQASGLLQAMRAANELGLDPDVYVSRPRRDRYSVTPAT
jgi:hypothetical protein